jgi:hypothetical protein
VDAVIDVSAQFGGRDAAQTVLPYFKALKEAAKGATVPGFVARKLAFILRVDGEVNTYGDSGPCNIDVDQNLEYVSVDLVVTIADRETLGGGFDSNPIVLGVLGSVPILAEHLQLPDDGASLRRSLLEFSTRYLEAVE